MGRPENSLASRSNGRNWSLPDQDRFDITSDRRRRVDAKRYPVAVVSFPRPHRAREPALLVARTRFGGMFRHRGMVFSVESPLVDHVGHRNIFSACYTSDSGASASNPRTYRVEARWDGTEVQHRTCFVVRRRVAMGSTRHPTATRRFEFFRRRCQISRLKSDRTPALEFPVRRSGLPWG